MQYASNAFLAAKISFINASPILRGGVRGRQQVMKGIG